MKLRILLSFATVLAVSIPAVAQDDAHSKKAQNCSGSISQDGLSFTCDKDHHIWKISNPAALRDMEGHQAKLTFRLTSTVGEIFVTSASVIQQQTLVHNPGDSAFRR
jgi:hypothetical protein